MAMSCPIYNSKPRTKGEEGYLLVGLLFMVALILVALAVAAPKMAIEIQRDKEQELLHRGNQYVRAIKLYYTKFGRYPINISQLENTNNIRFLRKKYKDPFTGKDEWRLIHLGEAKVPTMGLFGQTGSTGSTGSSGSTTSSSSFGTSTSGSSSFSSSPSSSSSIFGASGSTGSTGSTTNSTLGGGPVVGVASTVKRTSLKEYKKQKHYNEWEFVYDPLAEQLQAGKIAAGSGGSTGPTGSQGPVNNSPNPSPSPNPTQQ